MPSHGSGWRQAVVKRRHIQRSSNPPGPSPFTLGPIMPLHPPASIVSSKLWTVSKRLLASTAGIYLVSLAFTLSFDSAVYNFHPLVIGAILGVLLSEMPFPVRRVLLTQNYIEGPGRGWRKTSRIDYSDVDLSRTLKKSKSFPGFASCDVYSKNGEIIRCNNGSFTRSQISDLREFILQREP